MSEQVAGSEPATSSLRRLARPQDGRPAAPIRQLHLGVGNFFRAHQAWYSGHASDAEQWGIAAFTGRSAEVAEQLTPQDGLYTLITAHPDGQRYEVVDSLSAVHPADDLAALLGYFTDPGLAVVTSTITEAGYLSDRDGGLALADERVRADIEALTTGAAPQTAPGRIIAGLRARRAALGEQAPLTFVPCDNLSGNGRLLRRVLLELAAAVDDSLVGWIEANAGFVTTMVDRITPRTTEADRAAVRAATGVDDPAAVVTEPFSEWVLQGEFVAGHPDWASAGAQFVSDVEPYETRKLWLLNGSHSLLAYAGTIVGHQNVAQAIADPQLRGWVEQWWDLAATHLELPADQVVRYREALLARFANPTIVHQLAQIAGDGSVKLPTRIVPVLNAELEAGRMPTGALRAVAAWVLHLRGLGAPVTDVAAEQVTALAQGDLDQAVPRVLRYLGVTAESAVAPTLELVEQLQQAHR